MRIATKPLFAWDELEDSPTLKTIKPNHAGRQADRMQAKPGTSAA